MNVAERRGGECWNRPHVRPPARSRTEIEPPRARGHHMAGCEFSPATVMRSAARANYRTCYRFA